MTFWQRRLIVSLKDNTDQICFAVKLFIGCKFQVIPVSKTALEKDFRHHHFTRSE